LANPKSGKFRYEEEIREEEKRREAKNAEKAGRWVKEWRKVEIAG